MTQPSIFTEIGSYPLGGVLDRSPGIGSTVYCAAAADGGLDGNSGSNKAPVATIQKAIEILGTVTSPRQKRIVLLPNFVQEVASATALGTLAQGLIIEGVGHGETQPIIRLTTATTAVIPLNAEGVVLRNINIQSSIASLVASVIVSAKNCRLENCRHTLTGSGTIIHAVKVTSTTDNVADGLSISGHKIDITSTAFVGLVHTAGDLDGLNLKNIELTLGVNTTGAIVQAATGKDFTSLKVDNVNVYRLNTDIDNTASFFLSDTTDNTGYIKNCTFTHRDTNTILGGIDVTGVGCFNNLSVGAADKSGTLKPAVE